MLVQLRNAGKLERVVGMAVGQFHKSEATNDPEPWLRAEALGGATVVSGGGWRPQFSPASQTRGSSSWLADLAQKQAVELGDPSPRRVLIATGRVDVVELW